MTVPTWATVADVAGWLGTSTPTDPTRLAQVTDHANALVWRRRQAAGYTADDPAVPPGPDVVEGIVEIAGVAYRSRGVIDGLGGLDVPVAGPALASSLRKCGCPRAVVA